MCYYHQYKSVNSEETYELIQGVWELTEVHVSLPYIVCTYSFAFLVEMFSKHCWKCDSAGRAAGAHIVKNLHDRKELFAWKCEFYAGHCCLSIKYKMTTIAGLWLWKRSPFDISLLNTYVRACVHTYTHMCKYEERIRDTLNWRH